MTDTYTELERGKEAQKLLENTLFREAFDSLRENIVKKWRDCSIRDIEGLHDLKLMDRILTDVEKYIAQIAQTGKMANLQLEQEKRIEALKKTGTYR